MVSQQYYFVCPPTIVFFIRVSRLPIHLQNKVTLFLIQLKKNYCPTAIRYYMFNGSSHFTPSWPCASLMGLKSIWLIRRRMTGSSVEDIVTVRTTFGYFLKRDHWLKRMSMELHSQSQAWVESWHSHRFLPVFATVFEFKCGRVFFCQVPHLSDATNPFEGQHVWRRYF